MTKEDFFNQVEELLELEGELETNDDTSIEDILEIDSLAHITLISLIKDSFGVEIKAEDFSQKAFSEALLNVLNAVEDDSIKKF